MDTDTSAALPLLRLLHLVSPSLPVGAFAYSQGIEWAVEAGWLGNAADVDDWLEDQLRQAMAYADLPILVRLHAAAGAWDLAAMAAWTDQLLALRETAELRAEEGSRGRALADLLAALGVLADAGAAAAHPAVGAAQWGAASVADWRAILTRSQLAGFAFAAAAWQIAPRAALLGYAWGWLENLTLAAIKLVPLGQSEGQRILARRLQGIPAAVDLALGLRDDDIGATSPALAIASSAHETQYTRLFRS